MSIPSKWFAGCEVSCHLRWSMSEVARTFGSSFSDIDLLFPKMVPPSP